jgi:hypothetical protein
VKSVTEKKLPKVDLNNRHLRLVFREYEALGIQRLWAAKDEDGEGYGSGKMWMKINEDLAPKTISRASVIFFLNRLVDQGVCNFRDATGKGGHHRIYFIVMTREEFWKWLAKLIAERLVEASGLAIEELLEGFPNPFLVVEEEEEIRPLDEYLRVEEE